MKYNIDLLVRYKNLEVQSKEEALEQIIKDVTEYEAPCELSEPVAAGHEETGNVSLGSSL